MSNTYSLSPQFSTEPEGPVRGPKPTTTCLGAVKTQGYLELQFVVKAVWERPDITVSLPPLKIAHDSDSRDRY